jgi:hypothetical protein
VDTYSEVNARRRLERYWPDAYEQSICGISAVNIEQYLRIENLPLPVNEHASPSAHGRPSYFSTRRENDLSLILLLIKIDALLLDHQR